MLCAFGRSPTLLSSAVALSPAAWRAAPAGASARDVCLTILHNDDRESQLLNAGGGLEDFGGAARFAPW